MKRSKNFSWLRPSAPLLACVVGIVIAGNWSYFGGCGFSWLEVVQHLYEGSAPWPTTA